ncbi:DMT family transporter [Daejeonella lutea]|uniref:Guanidinium exporter n=1 Tax=Daejeonella lutea TaxID=572036 RepID=A0A1T5AKR6_9SPHI|nr:multidrug efflux SMR transporter [Daejeonella lutea]SKB35631.1 quaternary ammonium compound-resistance protein SugE [Daejeonella lutea]
MAWLYLIIGGLFEVGFTSSLAKAKDSTGSEFWLWIVAFLFSVSISMYMLFLASKTLPMGTSYAVWAGIGAVGSVVAGIIFFKEPTDFWRMFFLFLLISSIIGLKLSTKH